MNGKVRVVAALVLGVVLGSIAIRLQTPGTPEGLRQPGEIASVQPAEVPTASAPAPVLPVTEGKEPVAMVAREATRESPFANASHSSPGYSRKPMPVDFEIHVQFMSIGAAREMGDERQVQNFQAQHELTDEELAQVIEAGTAALRSDRAFQKAGMKAICERGRTFRSVEELGAALKEEIARVEANQEELARNAMQQLDPVVSMKIRDKVLHRPRGDMTASDLAVIMAMRNHGLETELERVCSQAR